MATNLQRFSSSYGSRRFGTYVIVERRHLWQKKLRHSDCWQR